MARGSAGSQCLAAIRRPRARVSELRPGPFRHGFSPARGAGARLREPAAALALPAPDGEVVLCAGFGRIVILKVPICTERAQNNIRTVTAVSEHILKDAYLTALNDGAAHGYTHTAALALPAPDGDRRGTIGFYKWL